ncbi:MAG: hypothetical protein V2I36_06405 [Desulfopila sp.]|nr:hypothetical protein [Desulfopila sp.]
MIICVDFDGTIVDHRFPEIGAPVPGAIKWMKRLNKYGAKLILYTMRSDSALFTTALSEALEYLRKEGVELYGVNENPTQKSWTVSPKVNADVYVDDLAFGCPLIFPKGFARPCADWSEIGPELERMCLSRGKT